MKLSEMYPNFNNLPSFEAKCNFIYNYRLRREKDLTSLQAFDLSAIPKVRKTTSTEKRERVSTKKVSVTAEGMELLKKMGLI